MTSNLDFQTASEVRCAHDCAHADTVTENGVVRCYGCTCTALAQNEVAAIVRPIGTFEVNPRETAATQEQDRLMARHTLNRLSARWYGTSIIRIYTHLDTRREVWVWDEKDGTTVMRLDRTEKPQPFNARIAGTYLRNR